MTREEKDQGCTMLFLNPRGEVLMLLRDDKPGILYPNMWDLPGGHLEKGEETAGGDLSGNARGAAGSGPGEFSPLAGE